MKLPAKLKPSTIKSLRQAQTDLANLQHQANLILQGENSLKYTVLEMYGLPLNANVVWDIQKGELLSGPEEQKE